MRFIPLASVFPVLVTALVASSFSSAAGNGADKNMQAVPDLHASLKPKFIETLSPPEARKQSTLADAVNVVSKKQGKSTYPGTLVPGVKSTDRSIAGVAGQIAARIHTPGGALAFTVILYYHGGVSGLAKQANTVVAPEHKFSASWDDALAAYKWTSTNAATSKGDPKKLALADESAGGNLAVATAIAVRDAGLLTPLHVLASYTVSRTSATTELDEKYANAKLLNRPMIKWFVTKLINSPSHLKDPRLEPIDAKLKGLPSVTSINASIDALLSDGVMLEDALKKAGVPVEHKMYSGVTHELFGMATVVKKAKEA